MKIFLVLLLSVCSFNVMALQAANSTKQFCADRKSKNYVKKLALDENTRLTFQNQGGLANGGICWWHSRFQRNALYLTFFNPKKPAPTQEEAKALINAIRSGNKVVEIPGYENFNEFSRAHSDDILRELEKWQKVDGFAKGQWIRGLAGKSHVKADKLQSMMNELYQEVEVRGNVSYQKLQIKGIVAHAWLVVKMVKTADGYILSVIDSNNPKGTDTYTYTNGETSLSDDSYGEFTPYLERKNELEKVQEVIKNTCK